MEQTREILQNEIEAARAKSQALSAAGNKPNMYRTNEHDYLYGYIQGLQTAVRLLEKQQTRELPY